jgi:hypothetical protein
MPSSGQGSSPVIHQFKEQVIDPVIDPVMDRKYECRG